MSRYTNTFEYFKKMTSDWTREDLLRRCYDLCNDLIENAEEIRRLNKIINDIEIESLSKDYKVIGKLTGDPSYDPNLSNRQHFINISRNTKLIQGKINEIIDTVNEINERR